MNIFDEVREAMRDIPEHTTTVDDVFLGIEIAHALTPVLRARGIEGDRQIFLKFAAIAIYGLEFVDAEIEAEADDEIAF